jgi:Golgi apparatus protein 1
MKFKPRRACLQVKMAEDIDFKYPTRRACAWEISHFCKGVPHGHARIIRCLQVRSRGGCSG